MATAAPPVMKTGPYREITVPAVVFGVLLGAGMTAGFVYIALKLGFTLPGSTVAAILGFGVLRGLLREGTIVENNINQTIASGVNNASAGISFTLPALFILGLENPDLLQFDPLPFILSAMAGSFMGVVMIIPLRKQMIEFDRLRFPSGIAVGTLLKSPGAGARQAKLLGAGFALSALITFLSQIHWLDHEYALNGLLGIPEYIPIAFYVSFASLGAGLLAGKGGLPFVFGGILAWWLIAPVSVGSGWVPDTGVDGQAGWQAGAIFGSMLRPLGIGILIGGAVASVIASFPALRSAITSLSSAAKTAAAGGRTSDEMPSKVLVFGLIGSVVLLFIAAMLSTEDVSTGQAIAMALVGTVWLGVAGLIVAQATGMTDISPLSGMSLIAVTLIFFISSQNVIASILLGVAICIGIGQCADMMSDLKSGHLVGSIPRRQQMLQFAVGWLGTPIAIGVLFVFWGAGDGGVGGFGPTNPQLSAPQGDVLASIIQSLQNGNVAVEKYLAGAGAGVALSLFPISGVAVLVGLAMYLPISITLTYGVGCIISMQLRKSQGAAWMGSTLVPVAAGFIVGEALTALTWTLVSM